jgi:hypothetical protein
MKFEVGKEYRTINGEKAGIFYDGSVESDYIYDYPLKGYIEWKEGQRQDASWTSEGRYTGTGGYHGRDLIPQPMTVTHYAFAVWRGGSVDLFTRETLTEAKEVRALFRAQGSKVSEIVAVTLELQGDQK